MTDVTSPSGGGMQSSNETFNVVFFHSAQSFNQSIISSINVWKAVRKYLSIYTDLLTKFIFHTLLHLFGHNNLLDLWNIYIFPLT